MNKRVTPQQLDLVKELSREEAILATAPHIDPDRRYTDDAGGARHQSPLETNDNSESDAAEAVLGSGLAFRDTASSEDDFNWANDDSIVLREQPATAIYTNKHGTLVIRQKGEWDADQDSFTFITPENAVIFMEALAEVARR